MEDQKIENLLNLALEATNEERKKSQILNIGYSEENRTWELIVKYTGDLKKYTNDFVQIVTLYNEYAILTVKETMIPEVASWPEVAYIEKPKRLFFEIMQAKSASCLSKVQLPPQELTGKDVLIGIVDSGIDYKHSEFIGSDGKSRIAFLWDQSIPGKPPEGYYIGTEYTGEALMTDETISSFDGTGHGTAVAAIAAGNSGVAFDSQMIVVKMGQAKAGSFPRTTELMQAVNYIIEKAVAMKKPVAINLSFGNTYGSHSGNSLVETYLDDMSNYGKCVIITGTGNEGNAAGHTEIKVADGERAVVPFVIQAYETTMNIQIWKLYADEIKIKVMAPNGKSVGYFEQRLGPQRFTIENTELLIYYGEPSPYSIYQEIFIDFIPKRQYLDDGQWQFELVSERSVEGRLNFWMPSQISLNKGTAFLYPTPYITLTIPSSAYKTISVGAYDSIRNIYADFSGRGYTIEGIVKPDLVAPGVGIRTAAPGNRYETVNGTSFAAPFVTGSAALLMEWGIVNGNDDYLYGEKLKAYLRKGAKPVLGFGVYPNPQVGWGALCVEDSIPG